MAMTADWAADLDEVERPKPEPRRVERPVDILSFIVAGNATFTLSGRTTRFTYRVRANDAGTLFFVGVLSGPDNNADYSYLGTLRSARGENLTLTKKSRAGDDAQSVRAFRWFWRALTEKDEASLAKVEFRHEGRCGRCNRLLTVPESLDRGIGPECWERMGGE
jgi:hypothetical protein